MAVLRDPPEVKRHAKRGDPPNNRWPGRPVVRQNLMEAAGDPRDWFRYGHRLKAYEQAWMEFADARRRRRNFTSTFEWNQILILGDYGTGKTTLAIHMARHFFGLGHPVFSNASALFGWHLEHEEMYTAMGFMPANSVLLVDESSAAGSGTPCRAWRRRPGTRVRLGDLAGRRLRQSRQTGPSSRANSRPRPCRSYVCRLRQLDGKASRSRRPSGRTSPAFRIRGKGWIS